MKAIIINIGDELLVGQTVNTNAAWLGTQLNLAGISAERILVIPDRKEDILYALQEAGKYSLALITGGLGPTKDDITKNTFAEFFGVPLVENKEVLQDVIFYFTSRGREVSTLNKMQALVPQGCKVIRNKNGTAPGMWMERNGTHYISMPGVPYEMQEMVKNEVLPYFLKERKKNGGKEIYHHTIVTVGIGESVLAEKIAHWEEKVKKENFSLAYLPQPGMVRLRLSSYDANENTTKRAKEFITELKQILEDSVIGEETFGEEPLQIQQVVVRNCLQHGISLALAESCTGGYASSLITSVPGCSEIFKGAVISYSNEMKRNLLNVRSETLEKYGAVSEECVHEMVRGCLDACHSDVALAFTGVAGPGGGSEEKPVGTVWIGWGNKSDIRTKKFLLGNHRQRNIHLAAVYGLNELRKFIGEKYGP